MKHISSVRLFASYFDMLFNNVNGWKWNNCSKERFDLMTIGNEIGNVETIRSKSESVIDKKMRQESADRLKMERASSTVPGVSSSDLISWR